MDVSPYTPLLEQFQNSASQWYHTLFPLAQQLFFMLATIEIAWGAIQWMLAQQSHDHVALGLFRKFVFIGLMYALLLHANTWIPAFLNSWIQAGSEAAGVNGISPGEVYGQGVLLAGSMLKQFTLGGLLFKTATVFAGLFCSFLIFFSFLAIAIQLSLALLQAYLVCGAGVFLLGFGGFAGTLAIVERYLSFVVGVGIKLFISYLIIGLGQSLVPIWNQIIQSATFMESITSAMWLSGASILYAACAWQIPSLAASLASGSVGFGLQETVGALSMATRLSTATVAAPLAIAGSGVSAVGIGVQGVAAARAAGSGVLMSGIKGLGSSIGAVSREAIAASVPRLGRVQQNLAGQRKQS